MGRAPFIMSPAHTGSDALPHAVRCAGGRGWRSARGTHATHTPPSPTKPWSHSYCGDRPAHMHH